MEDLITSITRCFEYIIVSNGLLAIAMLYFMYVRQKHAI